jgi:hypothetical protein
VPEEKKRNRAFGLQCLNANVSAPTDACATEAGYPNGHRRSWCQPLFNKGTQGFLYGFHRSFSLVRPGPVAIATT